MRLQKLNLIISGLNHKIPVSFKMFYQTFKKLLPPIAALRIRNLALLVAATVEEFSESERVGIVNSTSEAASAMSRSEQKSGGQDVKISLQDGLVLYYDKFSYYSQKVVMVLHEKHLPFEGKFVNLIKSEQYQSWFLNLNLRGEVPVLQDTGKIIPDSARIIDYIEDNFSNGGTPRLIPMDQGAEIRQNVTNFRHMLQKVPEGKLTTGSLLNPQFTKNPKVPFIAPVRRALANAEKNSGQRLREFAEKYPLIKEVLLKKAADREAQYKELMVEENFKKVLDEIDHILTKVEQELAKHTIEKQDWWLCSDRYTIADVELTILLVRISQLGLEHVFWSDGKKPHIERYYERVKQRESYKKTIPGTLVLLKTILVSQAPIVIGVVAAIALIVGGAIIAKKYIP